MTAAVARIALLVIWAPATATAQAGASFLAARSGSTRAAALGGAGAALVGDAGALFANPAGIAPIRHLGIEAAYEPFHAGVAISSAALALRIGRLTWGVGAQVMDSGFGIPPAAGLAMTSLVYRRGMTAIGVSGYAFGKTVGACVFSEA